MISTHVSTQLSEITMTPEEAELLGRVAWRLERLLDASNKFVAPSVESPLPESPIHAAYKADLRDPYQEAFLLLFATEDHLRTILLVLKKGPLPGFALYTVLRAAG